MARIVTRQTEVLQVVVVNVATLSQGMKMMFEGCAILRELRLWFQLLTRMDENVRQKDKERAEELADIQDRIHRAQIKQKEIQRKKVALYERYSEGEISAETFVPEREKLSAEANRYVTEIEELSREEQSIRLGKSKRQGEFDQLMLQVRIFGKEEKLTREMTEAFLDSITITDPGHMEITWKWDDLVKELRENGGM